MFYITAFYRYLEVTQDFFRTQEHNVVFKLAGFCLLVMNLFTYLYLQIAVPLSMNGVLP